MRSDFGSCSGCDALEGSNGYDYIEDTMTSVKEFSCFNEIIDYLKSEKRDFLYSEDVCEDMIKLCDDIIKNVEGSNLSKENLTSRIKKFLILENLKN